MSDIATDAPEPTTDTQPAGPETEPTPDLQAELDKWKSLARENEKRAKSNAAAATELEKLRKSQMSEVEKAVAEAEARGRQSATVELGTKVAHARALAALTGVVDDPASVLEFVDLGKFVTEGGDVDEKAIEALRDKWSGIAAKAAKDATPPKVPAGPRGDGAEIITSRDQFKKMTPEAIVAANREGRIRLTDG